jgi:hypothetical protein
MRAPPAFLWVKAHGAHRGGGRPERGARRGRQASPAADAAAARAEAPAEAPAGGATLHALPAARFCKPSLGTRAFCGPLPRLLWCMRACACLLAAGALVVCQGPNRPGDINIKPAPTVGPTCHVHLGRYRGPPAVAGLLAAHLLHRRLPACVARGARAGRCGRRLLVAGQPGAAEPGAAWRALGAHMHQAESPVSRRCYLVLQCVVCSLAWSAPCASRSRGAFRLASAGGKAAPPSGTAV